MLRPGPGRIAVQEIDLSNEIEVQTITGGTTKLYVANEDRSEGKIARVVAVARPWIEEGFERTHNPEYDVGAIVVIGRWSGTTLQIDRDKYIILREEDVLGELDAIPQTLRPTVSEDSILTDDDDPGDKAFTEMLNGPPTV